MAPSPEEVRAFMLASPGIEVEATRGSPEDYDDRNGYLADFLGAGSDFLVPIPLLRVTTDLVQVERAPKERPFELRYQNFSVIMRRSRRLCCTTGVNIDGSAPFFHIKRPGWKIDPPIPQEAQVGGAEFYVPTVFDRGHMVRRRLRFHDGLVQQPVSYRASPKRNFRVETSGFWVSKLQS